MIQVTNVKITLPEATLDDRIRAYAVVVIDDWLKIHDVKLIEAHGRLVVWFPQRAAHGHCPECSARVERRHAFCWSCGSELPYMEMERSSEGRMLTHFDVVHTLRQDERSVIERAVVGAYHSLRGTPPPSIAARLAARRASAPAEGLLAAPVGANPNTI
jgi:DNA-binding cell septation regulator SpoVG